MGRCGSIKRTRNGASDLFDLPDENAGAEMELQGIVRLERHSSQAGRPRPGLLGRQSTGPRANGGGDVQTVHSARRFVSGYPYPDGSTNTRATDRSGARTGRVDYDDGSNGAGRGSRRALSAV